MSIENECIFCLESGTDLIKYNHCNECYIHKLCLIKWLLRNQNSCLICRKKIFNDDDLNNLPTILRSFNIDEEDILNFNNEELKDLSNNLSAMINENNNTQLNNLIVINNNSQSNYCKYVGIFLLFTFLISIFNITFN